MIWLFHQLNFTCLFPDIFDSTHVTVDIEGDDVLEIIKRKSVVEIVNDIIPINFEIKNVIPKHLLNRFSFVTMINDLHFTIAFIQNKF